MRASTRSLTKLFALLLLVIGSVALRVHPAVITTSPAGIHFIDADTVRRLVRLHDLDTATEYPSVEPRDGFPEGTVLQWTLSMDWVIRALDAIAPRIHPNARRYETGAALAGPVLGGLAVLAFALLVRRLLAPPRAALAALLYAVSAPAIEVTRLGNGDHQTLQDLCAVVSLLGCLVLVAGNGGNVLALLTGAALGLSLWVNAESMVLLVIVALMMLVSLSLCDRATVQRRLPALLLCASACAAVTVTGQLVESGGALTLQWDRISCFQGAASLALIGFLGLTRVFDRHFPRPAVAMPLAAAVAAALAAAPFLLVPALREGLGEQLLAARAMSGFATACVAEYKALFASGTDLARLVFGGTVFLAPLCLTALLFGRCLPLSQRAGIAVPAVCLGALVLDQVKLSHLFAIPWALLLVAGGAAGLEWIGRWLHLGTEAMRRTRWTMGLLLAGHAIWHMLTLTFTPPSAEDALASADRREVVAALQDLAFSPRSPTEGERVTVMAPWDLGHYLLYDTEKPIVASSYQRRIDGIRDSFDVLCSQTPEQALEILRRCRCRWWVRNGDPSFLLQYHVVVAGRTKLGQVVHEGDRTRIDLDASVQTTLWAKTAAGAPSVRGFELVFESKRTSTWWGGLTGPPFRVFRIHYADEPN
ncbi:MAG: hypothetical protein ABIP94_04835 [Planctomycetota bacterium]